LDGRWFPAFQALQLFVPAFCRSLLSPLPLPLPNRGVRWKPRVRRAPASHLGSEPVDEVGRRARGEWVRSGAMRAPAFRDCEHAGLGCIAHLSVVADVFRSDAACPFVWSSRHRRPSCGFHPILVTQGGARQGSLTLGFRRTPRLGRGRDSEWDDGGSAPGGRTTGKAVI